jgi:hypothetical protein
MNKLFIKMHSGSYLSADNGSVYSIRTSDANEDNTPWWIEVYNPAWAVSAQKLGEDYADRAEAQAALDEFMSAHEVGQFAPPITDEEISTETVTPTAVEGGK